MLRIGTGLLLLSLIIALIQPEIGSAWFKALARRFSRLAQHRHLAVLLVGFLALGLRVGLLPIEPVPQPIVHDEFGYLLAADTFSHGRLTNPTPRLWKHFESFNVIQKPTYQSYPQPAQGLILATGNVLLGHPFWGVWLSAGLLCACICWMLQAYLPARWALIGGIFAVLYFGVFSYWANSYWGGALGATGGALVLGALPRIKRSRKVRDAVVMAVGFALLANTRPYEGFVFSLPVAVALFAWMVAKARPIGSSVLRIALPMALTLAVTFACMGYYFRAVTRSPFRMPYAIERETYAIAPYFLWQPLRPRPVYNSAVMEKMYAEDEMSGYHLFHSPAGILVKLFWTWRFYLGLLLGFPLVMLLFSLPFGFQWKDVKPQMRFLLVVMAASLAGLLIETFYAPHYPAPIAGLLLLFAVMSMRHLQSWRFRGKPSGLLLVRVLPIVAVLMFVLRAAAGPLHIHLDRFYAPAWYQVGPASFGREKIQRALEQLPGQHLVIVHYKPEHDAFNEWVYNSADIDNSKIVWARELSSRENAELLQYFSNRRVWLLDADEQPPRLQPFEFSPSATSVVAGKVPTSAKTAGESR